MKTAISNRQAEIIATSGRILMEKGIKGLTTKCLADEMNFSESAIYRHFKNKDDIIILLLQDLASSTESRLNKIISQKKSAAENIQAIFKSQFSFFKKNPHYVIAILSESLMDGSEEIKNELFNIMQYILKILSHEIERGKKEGLFIKEIQTTELVHIIIGSFRLCMFKWKLSDFKIDIEKEGDKIINSILLLLKNKK
ncbi:MAG: TetR/AcrR family transcriptional regulator [Bacteroidota bacterium]